MIGEEVVTVLSATQCHQLDLAKIVKSHRPEVKWKKELKKKDWGTKNPGLVIIPLGQ